MAVKQNSTRATSNQLKQSHWTNKNTFLVGSVYSSDHRASRQVDGDAGEWK